MLQLWQFLLNLLADNAYCPKYIKWIDKQKGYFQFVNSKAVAALWGEYKNRPSMSYDIMSRSLRYYYKQGIMNKVDGGLRVYQFNIPLDIDPNCHDFIDINKTHRT